MSQSKQSGVTARTNFRSRVLVLPAKERFSFKVFNFTLFSAKSVYIFVKSKQNDMLHFYHLHKLLFPENARNQTSSNDCCNRQLVTNNMKIWSETVSKFSNAL